MKSSLKNLVVAASCLSGLAVVNAQQYTTLEPVGASTTRTEYVTATPSGSLPPSNVTGSSNIITSSSVADFGRRMDDLGVGEIGRRYIKATYDYVDYDKGSMLVVPFDTRQQDLLSDLGGELPSHSNGATVRANFPLVAWLDIGGQYSYQGADRNGGFSEFRYEDPMDPTSAYLYSESWDTDVSTNYFWLDATFHYKIKEAWGITPYARAAIGFLYQEYEYNGKLLDYSLDPVQYNFHDSEDKVEGMYAAEIGVEIPIAKIVSITPFAAGRWYFNRDYHDSYMFGGRLGIYLGYGFGISASVARSNDRDIYASGGISFNF